MRIFQFSFLIFLMAFYSVSAQAESLNDLIQLAVSSHPSIQSQQNQTETAKAEKAFAQQQFLPTPSVTIERNLASNSNNLLYRGDDTTLVFKLQQPLWTGGRLTAGVNKAEAQVQVYSFAVEESRQQIALKTIQAWGDWYAADLKVKAMESSVRAHERLKAQVKRRVEAGASSPAELVLTESRLSQTISTLEGYKALVNIAKVRLLQLIGKPVNVEVTSKQYLNAHFDGLEVIEEKVHSVNPSVKKLQAQLAVQLADVDVRKSELMPDVYLRAEHQQGNFTYTGAPDSNLIFVGVSTKFGAGLSNLSRIESAQKLKEAIENDLETTKRNVLEQVQSDWVQHLSLRSRIPFLEQTLTTTKATADAWDRQFLAGKKSWLEVMNTARELSQAELELADASALLVEADWRLAVMIDGVDRVLLKGSQLTQHQAKDTY